MTNANAMLEAVLATSLDAVIIIDEAGVISAWNGNAERTFGYTEAEALGQPMADLIIPASQRSAHTEGMSRYLSTGEVRVLGKRVKLAALHRDGHEFPIELAATIYSKIGTRRFIGFVRDLTAEMEAEAKIRDLDNELLHLSRLNAMGTAASMIAHEINQPLAAASNYLSVCKRSISGKERDDDSLSRCITEAQGAIFQAAEVLKIIREIVAARPLRRSNVSLLTLINESLKLLRSSLPFRPVVQLSPDARFVRVAKGPVEQVLVNIFKNAAEALHGTQDPLLSCSSRRDGDMVEVCITDNGPGLSAQGKDRLFYPKASSKDGGLGVGLSICRDIVEQHGGSIWCETSGSGAAFYFTLPAA